MKKNVLPLNILLFLLLASTSFANTAKTFTLNELEVLAKKHLEEKYLKNNNQNQKISISEPRLDPRIKVNPCGSELKVNILENQNSRNINVKISCDSLTPWQIYMPIKITKMLPVLVAVSNLDKGSVLSAENVEVNYIAAHKIRGATLQNAKSVIGAKLKRNMQKGSAIYTKHICIVCKGDNVNIIAKSDSFQIKTEGVALANGAIGEKIRIKNSRSGKVVSGNVMALNKVVINL